MPAILAQVSAILSLLLCMQGLALALGVGRSCARQYLEGPRVNYQPIDARVIEQGRLCQDKSLVSVWLNPGSRQFDLRNVLINATQEHAFPNSACPIKHWKSLYQIG